MKRHLTRLMLGPRDSESVDDRRRHGRVRCIGLKSSIGKILDLSPGGARMELRGRPSACVGECMLVSFRDDDGEHCEVVANVVGIRRITRFAWGSRYEVRVQFEEMNRERLSHIRTLALNHADTDRPVRTAA